MDTQEQAQDLIVIPQSDAMTVFTTPGALDPFLARVRQEIDAFTKTSEGAGTRDGRQAIASIAFKVAKVKTYVDSVGKTLADEVKALPKKVDAGRKHARDTLDAMKDEVRKPLTDWEAAEANRVTAHTAAIEKLQACALVQFDSPQLDELFAWAMTVEIGPQCEEYLEAYVSAKKKAIDVLTVATFKRTQHEAEQAELLTLRQAAAVRAQTDRENAIRKQAAEEALAEAEKAAYAKLGRDVAADALTKNSAGLNASEPATPAGAFVKVPATNTVEADDREHRASINRAAADALVAGGIDEATAKTVVRLIVHGFVPNVSIDYAY